MRGPPENNGNRMSHSMRTIFISSFVCTCCHYEICPLCDEKPSARLDIFVCKYSRSKHMGGHHFVPVSRIPSTKLQKLLHDVQSAIVDAGPIAETLPPARSQVLVHSARTLREVPLLCSTESDMFAHLWAWSIPMVVNDIPGYRPEIWKPKAFFKNRERDLVPMIIRNDKGVTEEKASLERFMQLFETPERERGCVVKLKDYPSTQSFANVYSDHFHLFQHALPFGMYTSDSGFYNLAAHFPVHQTDSREAVAGMKPDLSIVDPIQCMNIAIYIHMSGPKMYFASADRAPSQPNVAIHTSSSTQSLNLDCDTNPIREGSTRLHLDMSGAVNIMVEDLAGRGALWIIFAPEDTDKIRHYLCQKYQLNTADACPIHLQKYYLQNSDIRALYAQEQVIPYIFTQKKGQAICIPAGCAHQVSNNGACIKVAADFVCLSQVSMNRRLRDEFHEEGIDNVLRLDIVMWHAWFSLREQQFIFSGTPQEQSVELLSSPAVSWKRKAADIAATRASKRLHGPNKSLADRTGYYCPDPRCCHGAAAMRTYSSTGLYQHITQFHRITIAKEIWRTRDASACHEFDAWYIGYIQPQILDKTLNENNG
ncbi:hypothetical protein NM688_g4478 [Phlebia brevispora]|uniref:Uncharacterized protein n=1 Tax=Phlebia brevispora TaxID=194682 RepID=A0ACC1T2U0_9APHY|nr:hypothetical protein NM688_g4478 [Phlebia brevispora]